MIYLRQEYKELHWCPVQTYFHSLRIFFWISNGSSLSVITPQYFLVSTPFVLRRFSSFLRNALISFFPALLFKINTIGSYISL